jgi:hypothetical protein
MRSHYSRKYTASLLLHRMFYMFWGEAPEYVEKELAEVTSA